MEATRHGSPLHFVWLAPAVAYSIRYTRPSFLGFVFVHYCDGGGAYWDVKPTLAAYLT